MVIAMDRDSLLLVGGTGDVIQPTDGIAAIGSGGPYALAAARALLAHTQLTPAQVVRTALEIKPRIFAFTPNRSIEVEEAEVTGITRRPGVAEMTPRQIVEEPGPLHRRPPGCGQAGRRHCHPQPLAKTEALLSRRRARTSPPRTSSMIGPTGVGKPRSRAASLRLVGAPFTQGRGHQVHRGRTYRGQRCRAHDPRSRAEIGGRHDSPGGRSGLVETQAKRKSQRAACSISLLPNSTKPGTPKTPRSTTGASAPATRCAGVSKQATWRSRKVEVERRAETGCRCRFFPTSEWSRWTSICRACLEPGIVPKQNQKSADPPARSRRILLEQETEALIDRQADLPKRRSSTGGEPGDHLRRRSLDKICGPAFQPRPRTFPARACLRSAAGGGRHQRQHALWTGAFGSHPVYRGRGVSPVQAQRLDAGVAGAGFPFASSLTDLKREDFLRILTAAPNMP